MGTRREQWTKSYPARMIARDARKHMIEAIEAAEPIDNTDPNDPIEPTERHDPIEPIDRTELREPIDSSEFCDHSDHFDPVTGRILGGWVK